MSKDLTFLEHTDNDSNNMRDMKSYWKMVMAMPEPERKVFFQQERVHDEEHHLELMVESNKLDEEYISEVTRRAQTAVADYELHHDESLLTEAELWADMALHVRQTRYTIANIRKQREIIQCQKKKLKMMLPPDEPSQS